MLDIDRNLIDEGLYAANLSLCDGSTWYTTTPTIRTISLPFYLIEWGHFIAGTEYYTVRENNRFLLFYTLSGSGDLLYNGKHYCLEAGTVAIIWCGIRHEYRTIGDEPWDFKWIHYHGATAHEYFRIIQKNTGPAIFRMEKDNRCIELIETITNTTTLNGPTQNLINAMRLTELMTLLCCSVREATADQPWNTMDQIDRSVRYMEEHMHARLSVEEIASAVFLSKYHFIRTFHKVMGISPYQYLTKLRVSRVKELLVLTENSLMGIAEQTGFCDSKNLISTFKSVTGQTPGQFRKANTR